ISKKLYNNTLHKALREVPQRDSSETTSSWKLDLQINLKKPRTQRRISVSLAKSGLSPPHGLNSLVCMRGDQQHCDEAKAVNIPHINTEALKKFNKKKKLVKKLAKKIPRILGPGLNKAGKFPSLLVHTENMVAKVNDVVSTIKFQMKKVLCLAAAVGRGETTAPLLNWQWFQSTQNKN
uniref:Ribosomal protein n=1 Tax=Chelydra serpentina TaxID=8475 RepID=A0A8C3SJF0_CHESE